MSHREGLKDMKESLNDLENLNLDKKKKKKWI